MIHQSSLPERSPALERLWRHPHKMGCQVYARVCKLLMVQATHRLAPGYGRCHLTELSE